MLITLGGEAPSRRLLIAISGPQLNSVSAQAARMIAALGAAALDHSASMIASASASGTTPGAPQLFTPLADGGWIWLTVPPSNASRPNLLRKVVQSSVVETSLSSTTAMV